MFELAVNKPAVIEPLIKLIPMMKLIGKFTVSDNIKLTFFLLELFCIPIIKIKCEKCGLGHDITIDLEELKVDGNHGTKIVEFTDEIKVELNYPTYTDMIDAGVGEGKDITSDQMFQIVHSCIRAVITPDERIDILSKKLVDLKNQLGNTKTTQNRAKNQKA